jgi:methylaspartate mutase sigma subunit
MPNNGLSWRKAVVTSTASDAHTWNLTYLQLLLEEMGYEVFNLGPCVTPELLASECKTGRPQLVVVSSVNGHGFEDGLRLAAMFRRSPELAATPLIIGGKLTTEGTRSPEAHRRLLEAGFTEVFDDGDIHAFRSFVSDVGIKAVAP